jgi:hypothetical protein
MGWIISQALYEKWHCSQELEEEFSEDIYSDGKQSAPLSGNLTQLAYLSPDKMTKFSRLSRFGMTFKPLTESRGEDLLMWYREAFLAKTLVQRGGGQELTELGQACGVRWHELSAKYDLDLCSWRTHQCLWDEELHWSSVTLPRWGMTVSGVLFQHPTAERPISETGSGYWLTPTTMNIAPTESRREKRTKYRASVGRKDSPGSLAEQVMTPKFWPTPCATDYKGSGKNGELRDRLDYAVERGATKSNDYSLEVNLEAGGHLNPMWVEWLMGWPLGWTDLKPLAMDRFQSWQQQHSEY